jgi:hypothetical protein
MYYRYGDDIAHVTTRQLFNDKYHDSDEGEMQLEDYLDNSAFREVLGESKDPEN